MPKKLLSHISIYRIVMILLCCIAEYGFLVLFFRDNTYYLSPDMSQTVTYSLLKDRTWQMLTVILIQAILVVQGCTGRIDTGRKMLYCIRQCVFSGIAGAIMYVLVTPIRYWQICMIYVALYVSCGGAIAAVRLMLFWYKRGLIMRNLMVVLSVWMILLQFGALLENYSYSTEILFAQYLEEIYHVDVTDQFRSFQDILGGTMVFFMFIFAMCLIVYGLYIWQYWLVQTRKTSNPEKVTDGDVLVIVAQPRNILGISGSINQWAMLNRERDAFMIRGWKSHLNHMQIYTYQDMIDRNRSFHAADYHQAILLLMLDSREIPFYSLSEQNEVLNYLQSKEEEGYKIVVREIGRNSSRIGRIAADRKYIYQRWNRLEYPDFNGIQDQWDAKQLYLDMQNMLAPYEGQKLAEFIQKELELLKSGIDVVGQCYHLIVIAQYCIVLQAIHYWNENPSLDSVDDSIKEALTAPSFGTWSALQDSSLKKKKLPGEVEKAAVCRLAELFHIDKPQRYGALCDAIVTVRNRWIGHGVMVYTVQSELLGPIAQVVRYILSEFLNVISEIGIQEQVVLPCQEDQRMLYPFCIRDQELYIYNGLQDHNTKAAYVNYQDGRILLYRMDDLGTAGPEALEPQTLKIITEE